MFVDFLTLLLINMVAGFVLLAWFVYAGLGEADGRRWVPGFAIVGLVATVFGGYITLHWPLPGAFNMAFGEMSVLFGILFLAAAVALAAGWSLFTVALYAFFAGWAAVLLGVRLMHLGMTLNPLVSGVGFILSGAAGVFALPVLLWFSGNRPVRIAAALVLLAAAGIWALTGYLSYWSHMASFAGYRP